MQAEKIMSIRKVGFMETMDIEVNHPKHIYYGGGIAIGNSHATGYGIIGYQCGFAKAHFPAQQYCSWLRNAKNKQKPFEEVAELISDAKIFGFTIFPPDFTELKINFQTDGESTLTAGISNIKGIGEANVRDIIQKIKELEQDFKPLKKWNWYEFLIHCGNNLSKTVIENLILTGSLRKFGELRSRMMAEYQAFRKKVGGDGSLTDSEIKWIRNNYLSYTNIADAIEGLANFKKEKGLEAQTKAKPKKNKKKIDDDNFWPTSKEELGEVMEEMKEEFFENIEKKQNRLPGQADIDRSIVLFDVANLLRNPITPYRDNPAEIAVNEEKLLGVSLTCSLADGKPGERWTMTCKELVDNPSTNAIIILKAQVEEVKTHIIKKGKEENIGREMAFLRVSDGTCAVEDISCFANQWEGVKDEETGEITTPGFKNIIMPGRVLEIQLEKGYQKKGSKPNNSLHVKDVWQI